jgi:hypothetical protein
MSPSGTKATTPRTNNREYRETMFFMDFLKDYRGLTQTAKNRAFFQGLFSYSTISVNLNNPELFN